MKIVKYSSFWTKFGEKITKIKFSYKIINNHKISKNLTRFTVCENVRNNKKSKFVKKIKNNKVGTYYILLQIVSMVLKKFLKNSNKKLNLLKNGKIGF